MFKNKKIKSNGFEPDSSIEAWKHYKKYYLESNSEFSIRKNYNFKNLHFYTYYTKLNRGCGEKFDGYNYANLKIASNVANRLYALHNSAERKTNNCNVEWCCATRRVGGECDFNFNEEKCKLFQKLIGENEEALLQLKKCKEMHHTLLNFSLMEAMGSMQGFKGSNKFDRFDLFIYELDRYFQKSSEAVLSKSSSSNKSGLEDYLSSFKNIYEYCHEVYFIESEQLIDKIIKNGSLSIETCDDVIRYMNLAEMFWGEKEFAFLKKRVSNGGRLF
ncbi:hypothetical protein [Adlercreutzia sp. ZJ154]|uniref:hypothetical protein n=1 Tax=Adlercreutzia sp. ZJ154 TaxID=2709790 RepID=UPI0013EB1CF1|nr:hypothetical protein [Adlercreutzia sp. ZJ154]